MQKKKKLMVHVSCHFLKACMNIIKKKKLKVMNPNGIAKTLKSNPRKLTRLLIYPVVFGDNIIDQQTPLFGFYFFFIFGR